MVRIPMYQRGGFESLVWNHRAFLWARRLFWWDKACSEDRFWDVLLLIEVCSGSSILECVGTAHTLGEPTLWISESHD